MPAPVAAHPDAHAALTDRLCKLGFVSFSEQACCCLCTGSDVWTPRRDTSSALAIACDTGRLACTAQAAPLRIRSCSMGAASLPSQVWCASQPIQSLRPLKKVCLSDRDVVHFATEACFCDASSSWVEISWGAQHALHHDNTDCRSSKSLWLD